MKGKRTDTGEEEEENFFKLRLYVAGSLAISARAIANLQATLEKYLKGRYKLEIVDVYQQPTLVAKENITAVPMLVKSEPLPRRLMIGDMSDSDRLLRGLGIS